MKRTHSIIKVAIFILISAITFLTVVKANAEDEVTTTSFSQAELAQILAPIALYPDTLLTHILIASTYPLEIVAADRWLTKNSELSEQDIIDKSDSLDWDASIKALLGFPRVLKNLSADLLWMQKVGDAFLQDEAKVLASIQNLRQKADEAGNLSQMDNVDIVREQKTIIIEPAQPEVIYVPYYDTRVVYGNWHWSHHQPHYWHRPAHYSYHHGPFYWHSGIHIGFDFFFSAFHWNNHHVVVHHNNRRSYYTTKRKYHSNYRISTSSEAKRWRHNPHHRKGVAYRSKKISHKYHSDRPTVMQNKVVRAQHKNKLIKNGGNYGKLKYNSDKYHRVNDRIKVTAANKYKNKQVIRAKKTTVANNNKHHKSVVKKLKSEPYYDKKWQKQKGIAKITKQKNYATKQIQQPKQYRNKVVKSAPVVKANKHYSASNKTYKQSHKQSGKKQYTSSNKSERSFKGGQGKSSHRDSRKKHK